MVLGKSSLYGLFELIAINVFTARVFSFYRSWPQSHHITEKTEAGLKSLYAREVTFKKLIHKMYCNTTVPDNRAL